MEMGFRSVWGSSRSGRAQKPHTSPTIPAPALKKYIRGEFNTSMVLGALREKSINMVSRREKKREKK